MVEKISLQLLFLLICAECTAAQELPKSCTIGVRHREKLTWLNISTLPNNTMTCLANLQKQEVELERYREGLMDVRNLINKRRRTRGQKSLPETEFGMIPEVQECFTPMFCNGKPLWGQFFVRDPATGKVTTKCRYEVDRAKARFHIMEAEYKLVAHELAEELKMIPTAVSPTARDATSTVTDIPGDASTIVPTVKPGAMTSTNGDVPTTVEASTATSTHRDIPTTNPTEITATLSTTVEDTTVIGRIGSTNGVCPPSTAWGPASTICPSTPREVTITGTNYHNGDATSTVTNIPGDASTIIPEVKPGAATSTNGDVSMTVEASTATSTHRDIPTTNPTEITTTLSTTVEDSFSAALTSTAPHVLSTKDLTTSPTTETTAKGSCNITFNGTCYWTHVEDGGNVNFTVAEEICSKKASTPAHFPNLEVYNGVVEDLRSKIPFKRRSVNVWTGVTIDTKTGNVTRPSGDTYVKWSHKFPRTGSSFKTRTHVLLDVDSNRDSTYQGMYNRPPQDSEHGVFCQSVE